MTNDAEREIAKVLLETINGILPKTTEKNNPSIKKVIEMAEEHYDIKKDTKKKK